jgi:ribonuclease-3
MEALKQHLGFNFHNERLLQSAFVHRSLMNEHPERLHGLSSNERLEFLGDAILNFLTATWLYGRFPTRTEGELTELRTALVKTTTLARFARSLNLGSYARLPKGQDSEAARDRPPLLADLFEALLGAIYLDQGPDAARAFVQPFLETEIERVLSGESDDDYRTRLQQLAQARFNVTPAYRVISVSGPDHQREFTVEVLIGPESYGEGRGSGKQAAAQEAARAGLKKLRVES